MARNGRYEAPGQPTIIVVDGGNIEGTNHHGPWVRWRFPWDDAEKVTATLWNEWDSMVEAAGYVWAAETGSVEK